MNIEEVANKIFVAPEELKPFSTIDPFNDNKLDGYICRRSDLRYGLLYITHVNEKAAPQVIYGTPKLHYPFDKNGVFHWPRVEELEIYEKLDGTNILAYSYTDGENKFTTYKTRLTPVLSTSCFGDFLSLWKEVLENEPWVLELVEKYSKWYNLSFELYGSRNPITIKYDHPITAKFLFAIYKYDIVPPTHLCNIATYIPKKFTATSLKDITQIYNDLRAEASKENVEQLLTEGYVFYALSDNEEWRMFKCKPEEIEKIHWAASGSIPRHSLWTTAINSFESGDTLENFIELLREEYPEHLITKSTIKIEKTFVKAKNHMKEVEEINKIWRLAKDKGFDITKDKNATFRFLSQYFDKSEMKKVGTIILSQVVTDCHKLGGE